MQFEISGASAPSEYGSRTAHSSLSYDLAFGAGFPEELQRAPAQR